jgi:hypothetical protein
MCVGVLSLCVVILGVALPAAAQTFPRTEISGGYQFVTFTVEDENESIPKGWYFEVAGNLNPMIGLVFQVGGNYKTFEESVTVGWRHVQPRRPTSISTNSWVACV